MTSKGKELFNQFVLTHEVPSLFIKGNGELTGLFKFLRKQVTLTDQTPSYYIRLSLRDCIRWKMELCHRHIVEECGIKTLDIGYADVILISQSVYDLYLFFKDRITCRDEYRRKMDSYTDYQASRDIPPPKSLVELKTIQIWPNNARKGGVNVPLVAFTKIGQLVNKIECIELCCPEHIGIFDLISTLGNYSSWESLKYILVSSEGCTGRCQTNVLNLCERICSKHFRPVFEPIITINLLQLYEKGIKMSYDDFINSYVYNPNSEQFTLMPNIPKYGSSIIIDGSGRSSLCDAYFSQRIFYNSKKSKNSTSCSIEIGDIAVVKVPTTRLAKDSIVRIVNKGGGKHDVVHLGEIKTTDNVFTAPYKIGDSFVLSQLLYLSLCNIKYIQNQLFDGDIIYWSDGNEYRLKIITHITKGKITVFHN